MDRHRNNRGNFGPRSNSGQNWTAGNGGNSMYNDFEPRNNRGPRSGNQAAPLMNMRTGMSRMDDDEDFTADTYGPAKNYGSMGSMGSSNKTPEQIAFDTEFTKWEQSFEDWKLNNRNHPDPSQYRVYEQKFLEIREKLLKKRHELYGEELHSGSGRNPFDNHLNAADAMANSIMQKFDLMSGNGERRKNINNQYNERRESRNNDNRVGKSDNEGSGYSSKPKSMKITPELDELIIKKRTLRRRWQRTRDSKIKTEVNNLQKIINEKMRELKDKCETSANQNI